MVNWLIFDVRKYFKYTFEFHSLFLSIFFSQLIRFCHRHLHETLLFHAFWIFTKIFVAFACFFLLSFPLYHPPTYAKQMDSIIHLKNESETSMDSLFVCHFSKQHKKQIWKELLSSCVFTIVPNLCGFIETTTESPFIDDPSLI